MAMTRRTIKYERDENNGAGFHLFEDLLDETIGNLDDEETPVYLELFHISTVEVSWGINGNFVIMEIPREWARKLGMLPPSAEITRR